MKGITRWLYPKLKIKRWFLLSVAGIFLFAIGLAVAGDRVALGYLEYQVRVAVYTFTGRNPYLTVPIGVGISLLGIGAIVVGFKHLMHSIVSAVLPDDEGSLVDLVYNRQHLRRGPRVVVIGGGTGLSALLRGLKEYTCNLTAIVTVADDGGSSGKLRQEMGVLPPGDIRNCLVALADTESIMEGLFSYRFETGTLKGHSLGNLLLVGLADTAGDFKKGIESVSKVFSLRGQVFPSTLQQVELVADFEDGSRVKGESAIRGAKGKITKVFLEPEVQATVPEALEALEQADLIVLGPGSLYTSVLPNLMVKELQGKIRQAKAPCVYVCNVMTEPGETDGYGVEQHVQAIQDHCGPGLVDLVLANKQEIPAEVLERYAQEGAAPVHGDAKAVERLGVKYFEANLVHTSNVARHDSRRLARELLKLLFRLKPMGERIDLVDSFLLHQKLRREP